MIENGTYLLEFVSARSRDFAVDFAAEVIDGPRKGYQIGESFPINDARNLSLKINAKAIIYLMAIGREFDPDAPDEMLFLPFVAKIQDGTIRNVRASSRGLDVPEQHVGGRERAWLEDYGWIWEDEEDVKSPPPAWTVAA